MGFNRDRSCQRIATGIQGNGDKPYIVGSGAVVGFRRTSRAGRGSVTKAPTVSIPAGTAVGETEIVSAQALAVVVYCEAGCWLCMNRYGAAHGIAATTGIEGNQAYGIGSGGSIGFGRGADSRCAGIAKTPVVCAGSGAAVGDGKAVSTQALCAVADTETGNGVRIHCYRAAQGIATARGTQGY